MDQDAAVASLSQFQAYCKNNPEYHCVYAERYLRDRRFESFAETERPRLWWKNKEMVAVMSDDGWIEKIAAHANGTWPPDKLGPPPRDPNCVVPRNVIEQLGLAEAYDDNGIAVGAQ